MLLTRPDRDPVEQAWGRHIVQSAHPRDFGALALVVGILLTLFVVSLVVGSPAR
jgi:hypothetical protein